MLSQGKLIDHAYAIIYCIHHNIYERKSQVNWNTLQAYRGFGINSPVFVPKRSTAPYPWTLDFWTYLKLVSCRFFSLLFSGTTLSNSPTMRSGPLRNKRRWTELTPTPRCVCVCEEYSSLLVICACKYDVYDRWLRRLGQLICLGLL